MCVQLILICVVVVLTLVSWCFAKKVVLPPALPGLRQWPIVGQALHFIGDTKNLWNTSKYVAEETTKLGGVSYVKICWHYFYVITDPDDIHTIMNTCLEKYFPYILCKDWIGSGLVTATTNISSWRNHRKLITKAFNQKTLDSFIGVFNKNSRVLVEKCKKQVGIGLFNFMPYLTDLQLQMLYQTVMGNTKSANTISSYQYVTGVNNVLNIICTRAQNILLHSDTVFNMTPLKKKQDEYISLIHEASTKIIKAKKKEKMEHNNHATTGVDYKAVLDLLLDQPETVMSEKEIKQEIDTFFVAGYDSVVFTSTLALILLGSHPEKQDKAFAEIKTLFGSSDRDLDKYDYSKLVYLDYALKETVRLYPIVPLQTRYAIKDVKLKNYTIPAGSQCFLLAYGVHRDTKVWGPDAEEFRPERWASPPENPGAFAGFSIGKRACMGKAFALMEMKTILVHMLRQYRIGADHTTLQFKLDLLLKATSGTNIALENRQ